MRDFYEILGVEASADVEEIKRAYRRMAHKYHPDKNPNDAYAEERFKEASRAYEVLSDPNLRRRYDRFGHAGVNAGNGAGDGQQSGFAQNMGDVFSEIFADFFGGRARGGTRAQREKGADKVVNLTVDFETAAFGGEQLLELDRDVRCSECSGTGAQPGSSPQLCHACGGGGEIRVQQGLFSVSKRCTYCKGRGRLVLHPCKACDGRGVLERHSRLKVKIPPGADSGTTLRYSGEGEPGTGGGPAGDLRVVLSVREHPLFKRDGADLHCEMPIGLVEATLGGQVEVPTLDGSVRMRLPPGTQNGRVFRLRGKGLPSAQHGARGDQHVRVMVETPVSLAPEQQKALQALKSLSGPRHYPRRAEFESRVRQHASSGKRRRG